MRYALIGCGRIAAKHIAAARGCGLDIAALCDIDARAAQRLDVDNAAVFSSHIEMLRSISPQLTAIATDSGSHAAIALDCMAAGSHVIIEKPMAMSLYDADRIIAAEKRYGVVAAVCHQNRFNLAAVKVKELVEGGALGVLSHAAAVIRWNRDESYYSQAKWRGRWASDGGALMNQCIHAIDMLRYLTGTEAERVYGVCRNRLHPGIEAEDVGIAAVELKNGALATIEGSTNIYPENLEETVSLFGSRASVGLGGRAMESITLWRCAGIKRPETDEQIENIYGNGHERLYRDVISAIESGGEPLVSAIDGRKTLELVLAIYKSWRDGAAQTLPLSSFSTKEMEPKA